MATKDIAERVDTVVDRLTDSQHPDWLRIIDAARLDEAAEADPAPEAAVRPYRWLIEAVGDGVTLTGAGYLKPAMVTAAMTELGWTDRWIGKQNREDQTLPILTLRESAQRAGLLRKAKGRLLVTKAGARLAGEPAELWWHVVRHLPDAAERAHQQAGILYLLQLAAGEAEDDELVATGMTILGWKRGDGGWLTAGDAGYATFEVRSGLERLGVLPEWRYRQPLEPPSPATIRVARAALIGRDAPTPVADSRGEPSGRVRLKVVLLGVEPPIWRRVEVPANYSLAQLDAVIQIAMGWENSHLHRFEIGEMTYSDQLAEDPWPGQRLGDEAATTVGEVARRDRSFRYEYDFGDSWEHQVAVEAVESASVTGPRVVAGARACPPEDCGGVWGYANLVAAVADPNHPEHDDLLEWVGGGFDPEAFDLARADAAVVAYGRVQARRRRRAHG